MCGGHFKEEDFQVQITIVKIIGVCRAGSRHVGHRGPQISNLWWMLSSVSIVFDPAMKMGSSRRFKRYSTTYVVWEFRFDLPFPWIKDYPGWFILDSKGNPPSFEFSWWARFHGRVETYADWVWYSSKIWELWDIISETSTDGTKNSYKCIISSTPAWSERRTAWDSYPTKNLDRRCCSNQGEAVVANTSNC